MLSSESKWNILTSLVIALLISLIWGPSLTHPFVWTDHAEVEQGALVPKTAKDFFKTFTEPKGKAISTARSAFENKRRNSSGRYEYFRPVKALTYWIDDSISSSQPWSYHLTNMLIHLLTCLMMLLLLSRLLTKRHAGLARVAALIHAVNPLNVEVVEWISARSDSLVALFTLLAIWFVLKARDKQGYGAWLLRFMSGLMAVFALWSKESGIVAIPIVALVSFSSDYKSFKTAFSKALQECWLPAIIVIAAISWRFFIISDIHLSQFGQKKGLGFWTIAYLFGHNLWMSFLPHGMTVADTVVVKQGPTLTAITGTIAWSAWFALGIWKIKKQPLIFIGATAWLLAIAPVSQLITLIHPRGDRYLYLPAIFAAATIGLSFWYLYLFIAKRRFLSIFTSLAFVLLILMLSFVSKKESEKWSNEIRLFVESLILQPHCIECWNNLAYAQAIRGNLQGAAYSCKAALAIERNRYRGARDGFSLRWILSQALLEQNQGAKAAKVLEEMIFVMGASPGLLDMLAKAYLQANRPAHALAAAVRALDISPNDQTAQELARLAVSMEIKLSFPSLFTNPEACMQ